MSHAQAALTDVISHADTHPGSVPEQLLWDLKASAEPLMLICMQLSGQQRSLWPVPSQTCTPCMHAQHIVAMSSSDCSTDGQSIGHALAA